MRHLKNQIESYKSESANIVSQLSSKEIYDFVEIVLAAYENESTIFACGNGGNASAVQNLVVDMNMHPFVSDDKGSANSSRNLFNCVSLTSCTATITGISNDLGYEHIFSEQLRFQGRRNDVLFCITGSGNSSNVIKAAKYAKAAGMKVVTITRGVDSNCEAVSDVVIHVCGPDSVFPGQTGKNNNNFHFEDCISKVTHIAVGLLKQRVQNENNS
jgi:D-sedoheptulose 7-phosphate isomerase